MMSQEVRDNVLKPILEEIMRDNTFQQGGPLGALGQVSKFTELLWSKAKASTRDADAYRSRTSCSAWRPTSAGASSATTPRQAADNAREQFIDYDIRAPWVNAARNTVLPFISYTYRAAPLIARAIATRPWKLGKYFALAYARQRAGLCADRRRRGQGAPIAPREGAGPHLDRHLSDDADAGQRSLRQPDLPRHPRWMPAGDVFDLGDGDIPPGSTSAAR
jgi:hypothetical protein